MPFPRLKKTLRRNILWLALAAFFVAPALYAGEASLTVPRSSWNGARAMKDIRTQLSFGSRALDTAGHEMAVQYIEGQLAKTQASVIKGQQWMDAGETKGPSFINGSRARANGPRHAMVNIIARFYPDNPRRVIVGTHYDSANSAASGVALLLETARALGNLPAPPVGVDFVFFDGEQGGGAHWQPLGSPYFARQLEDFYPDARPESAVLFDLTCAKNLALKPEPYSISAAGANVNRFWQIGSEIAPTVFKEEPYADGIHNSHIALSTAGIPSFLVADEDLAMHAASDKCSRKNLEAVGQTLLQYLFAL